MNETKLPKLARPQLLMEAIKGGGGGFDVDVFHVIDERDNQLIADEVLHGALSGKFVYNFEIQGKAVNGVSVVGARHLAYYYGGLKHRIVATVEKKGALHIFTSYPQDQTPMSVHASFLHEVADDPDFYKVIVEVKDMKKGNTVQVECTEMRFERRRDGSMYERPNFQKVAQAKGYRNAVLDLVPQDVVERFKLESLKLGKSADITDSVIEQKRSGVLRFAASKGISVDRQAIQALTFQQIAGLGDAARDGEAAFSAALGAMNVPVEAGVPKVSGTTPKLTEKTKNPDAVTTASGTAAGAKETANPPEPHGTPQPSATAKRRPGRPPKEEARALEPEQAEPDADLSDDEFDFPE